MHGPEVSISAFSAADSRSYAATVFAHVVVPPYAGQRHRPQQQIAGMRSTKVTSVCQLLALPWSELIGSTRLVAAHRRVRGVGVPSRLANSYWPSSSR